MHSEELVNFVRTRLRQKRGELQNKISCIQTELRLVGEAMAQSGSFQVVVGPSGVRTAAWPNGITVDVTEVTTEPSEPSADELDDTCLPMPEFSGVIETDDGEPDEDSGDIPESESESF